MFSTYKDLHILALNLYPFGVPFPELNNGRDPGAVPLNLSESTLGNDTNSSNGTFIEVKDETEAPFKIANKLFTLFIKKAKQPNTVKGLVGYVGKWEVDSQQKLYAHITFLFQSSSLSTESRVLLSDQLINLWFLLTSATGGVVKAAHIAHIFAENKAPQSLNIPHKDLKQRRIFQTHVATYLTLSDIYIKSMFLAKHATLLKGDSPNPKPRKKQQSNSEDAEAEGPLKQNEEHNHPPSDNSPSLTDPQAVDPDL